MASLLRLLLLLLAVAAGPLHAQNALVKTEHVTAELLVHSPDGLAPGKDAWLGLRIRHIPHWHTYWKNPGDSGLATALAWTLPVGVEAGAVMWPTPSRLPLGPLMNYGYEGDLLLPVPLRVPAGFSGSSLPVRLHAEWLVCREVCIPESGEFTLEIPARAVVASADLFGKAFAAQPAVTDGMFTRARLDGGSLVVTVAGVPPALRGQAVQVFAEEPGVVETAPALRPVWSGGQVVLALPLLVNRTDSPASMHAVLRLGSEARGIRVAFDIPGPWPRIGAIPEPAAITATVTAASVGGAGRAAGAGWLLALALAFVGGAILNLMPCVFPVLSLKILSFARHGADRKRALAGGIAYTVGVVLSFVMLAGLLLALRGSGEQLGWGFQLQSPLFVSALAILFTLIGLNLAGLFEFGSILPSSVASVRARHPIADDFLSGVLAVAVASPCTAPFMGVALGAALTQPAPQALAVFAALGLGMAAPYLAASAFPALARLLPRPGGWMARFKTLMAFPMFATVVWLVWVLGLQIGVDGVAAMLGVLLATGFAAWLLGLPNRSQAGTLTRAVASVAVLAATASWAWPALHAAPPSPASTDAAAAEGRAPPQAASATHPANVHADWQPWSPETVETARRQGRPVFVDFTAAWCVTCQYNKRTTLANEAVIQDFNTRNVLLLRADWTRRDQRITRELNRLGRSGVPVYVLYPAPGAEPRILSELLSVAEVRESLKGVAVFAPVANNP